jgi:SAM-dependent methyltransferase
MTPALTELETPPCPLCAAAEARFAYGGPRLAPYQVVRCKTCAFYYLSPRPTEEAMKAMYADESYFSQGEGGYDNYAEQEEALRRTFRRLLEVLRKRGQTGGRLLEVGCGYGYLLDEARPYFDRREGTDFSLGAVNQAETRADHIYHGDLEAVPLEYRYDVVIANHVIEHVYAPEEFLKRLYERLSPGGVLVVSTPNMGSLWRRFMRDRWPSFKVPEHISYFDISTLRRVMQQAGLHSLREVPYLHAFPLELIGRKLSMPVPRALARRSIWLPQTTVAISGQRPRID